MTEVLVFARVRRVLLLVGLVLAALPAGSALADTAIGKVGGQYQCFGSGVLGDKGYVVPSGGGTITSFSFQSTSANTGEKLDFLVLRRLTGPGYTVVGKTGLVMLKGTGLETFPANISVAGGDILGFWASGLHNCDRFGAGPIVAKVRASDPDTGAVFAMQPFGGGDLNQSAHLAPRLGAPPPPTSKRQCKHGGWKNFGRRFKNQGQCVRYVRHHHHKKHHHKKHHPGDSPLDR